MSEKTRQQELEHEIRYVEFLKRRLSSENFKKNTTEEDFEKTLKKYDKVKLRLKLLKGK